MNQSWKVLSRAATVSIVVAAALAACGGGDDNNNVAPPPTSQVPDSASQSVTGFISYLQALVVTMADLLEPVDTSMVTAPTDDISEPIAIN